MFDQFDQWLFSFISQKMAEMGRDELALKDEQINHIKIMCIFRRYVGNSHQPITVEHDDVINELAKLTGIKLQQRT